MPSAKPQCRAPLSRLDASDCVGVTSAAGDHFGYRVSVRGDEAWIRRHPGDGNGAAADSNGAVYRFMRGSGGWTEVLHLTPDNGSPGDSFGADVGFNPSWLVVGAQYEGTTPESRTAAWCVSTNGCPRTISLPTATRFLADDWNRAREVAPAQTPYADALPLHHQQ